MMIIAAQYNTIKLLIDLLQGKGPQLKQKVRMIFQVINQYFLLLFTQPNSKVLKICPAFLFYEGTKD